MIEISIAAMLGIYILFWLIVFYLPWFLNRVFSKRQKRKIIRQCSICTYTYFLSTDYYISKCPLCGSLNYWDSKKKEEEK